MLDVIYFLLEEDAVASTPEQSEMRSRFRTRMYPQLFNREYRFANHKDRYRSFGSENDPTGGGTGTSVVPSDGRGVSTAQGLVSKPYIPPTDGEIGPNPHKPFRALDAPLG